MPFCKKCGLELEADAVFCPECGAPRSTTAKSKPTGSEPTQTEPEDSGKTMLRQQPVYGILNLENLPAGHIIDERYEIKEKLGQGGFGAVYRAFDRKMKVDKALKVIPEAVGNDLRAMATLSREAQTMIRLNHTNIVRVYDFHDSGQVKFIDMEYVAGKSLTQLKLQHPEKRLPEEEVKKYAVQIAAGLSYAHSQGVIHRDVKPQNILLGPEGKVKIMDFGIAETLRSSMSRIGNASSSGTLVYMSPEQLLGENVGKESDVYSFGATLYELLSGHPPFYQGDINYQILKKAAARLEDVSDEMNSFLQKCLAKDYRERLRSFAAVERALKFGKQRRSTSKSRHPRTESAPRAEAGSKEAAKSKEGRNSPRRKSKLLVVLGLLWVLLIAFAGYERWSTKVEQERQQQAAIEQERQRLLEEERKMVSKGFVYVEGGTFKMGCTPEQSDCDDDEKPAHTVRVKSFYMSKHEVTQKEWRDVMGGNPSHFAGDNLPVEWVSWYDAVKFCNKKSLREGLTPAYRINGNNVSWDTTANGYRLPTEAEWEYAARGGNQSKGYEYSGSNAVDEVAWYRGNSGGKTHAVGGKQANELGLYDMSGNVYEWCWDWYSGGYYQDSPGNNPKGPDAGEDRVLRGGSWHNSTNLVRSANRGWYNPGIRLNYLGFRCVRNVL